MPEHLCGRGQQTGTKCLYSFIPPAWNSKSTVKRAAVK
jgi:hypothetical protein